MARSIVSITQSQIQAVDTIKGLEGRRARIYARKLHVEDIDITLHVVVADDVQLSSTHIPGVGVPPLPAYKYHRNIKRQARS